MPGSLKYNKLWYAANPEIASFPLLHKQCLPPYQNYVLYFSIQCHPQTLPDPKDFFKKLSHYENGWQVFGPAIPIAKVNSKHQPELYKLSLHAAKRELSCPRKSWQFCQ